MFHVTKDKHCGVLVHHSGAVVLPPISIDFTLHNIFHLDCTSRIHQITLFCVWIHSPYVYSNILAILCPSHSKCGNRALPATASYPQASEYISYTMAGNPFRTGNRRLQDTEGKPATSPIIDRAPDVIPKTKNKPKKRVTILSPPQSPAETRQTLTRRLSDGLAGSPPPPLRQGTQDEDDSSSSDEETTGVMNQAKLNARRNLEPDAGQVLHPVAPDIQLNGGDVGAGGHSNGGVRAPYNPFARTLASSEASFGLQSRNSNTAEEAMDSSQRPSRPGRPMMDVDQFKNILLNGANVPIPLETEGPVTRSQETSNTQNLPAPSRNPIFDSFAHSESPRTSWDHDRTNSDDEDDEGDESTTLMSLTDDTRLDTMAPPAPPKNKIGKAYPQTVSFADFDESIPSGFTKTGNSLGGTQHLTGIMRPQISRSSSDLNKPLPQLPPRMQTPTSTNAVDVQPISPPPAEKSSSAKPSPPPPPASRRQGPSAPIPSRPRISSGSSQQSIPKSEDSTASMESAAGKAMAPRPPPPPSRRAQQTTLPPPRRAAARPGSTLSRTPSNASYRSAAPSDIAASAPPPPPPRRDRSNKRSSSIEPPPPRRPSDQRSHNGDSVAGQDIAELDETEPSPWEADRPGSVDMLKDLDALQAEIEALRARQGEGGGGGEK
nr:hypothetical protein CFP56_69653 [Quercus suber]